MAKIISFSNQAGGVGKTTLCQNIGFQLANEYQRKVLLIDFDPQGSLTDFMGLEIPEDAETIYDSLISEELPLPIHSNIHKMDLVPTTIDLAMAEQSLIPLYQRELLLKKLIDQVSGNYDYVLIDCPPSLGILSVNAIVAANYVFVPIQTQYKSFRGTNALLKTVQSIKSKMNPELKFAGFCPSMYSSSNELDKKVLEIVTRDLKEIGTVFPPIPRATALADATQDGVPFAISKKKQQPIVEIFSTIAKGMEELS
jgi:chromosome partitioning protein